MARKSRKNRYSAQNNRRRSVRKTRSYTNLTRLPARTIVLGSDNRRLSRHRRRAELARRSRRRKRLRRLLASTEARRRTLSKRVLTSPVFQRTLSPIRTKICRSRKIRKEVLHALKKTGLSGQKRPVRKNPEIICRR